MLKPYTQQLREATLEISKDNTPQEKADNLNMIEAIIEGDMDVESLVDAIANGTLPVRYVPA